MNRSIPQLQEVVSLPAIPHCTGRPQWWKRIEDHIGIGLPDDYKQMINSFGYGRFGGYITPYNPFVAAPFSHNLFLCIDYDLKLYRQAQYELPSAHAPFPAYPESGGLLPWGVDEGAGTLCWLTTGSPNEWTIVSLDEHYSDEYNHFDLTLSEFLVQWMLGNLSFYSPSDEGEPGGARHFEVLVPDASVC